MSDSVCKAIKDKDHPYTMMSNRVITNSKITAKAKGLMLYFMMRPGTWKFNMEDFKNNFLDGEESIRSGWKELELHGYLHRKRFQDNKTKRFYWKHFAVFLAELEGRLPSAKIGIYTGYYYWQSHCPNWLLQYASFNWFARFPLWLAWYTNNDALIKIPSPWKSALYWQFSSHGDGLASGVESLNIDCSYFQGTQKEFNERYSTSSPIPPPVIVPPVVIPPTTTAGLYRVKHDFEKPVKVSRSSGWKPGTKLRGLPETVRLMGGRGNVLMSVAWAKYIQKINTPNGYRYVKKEKSGWTNAGPFPRVECLTFGGNVIEVTKIVGNKAYVKTYFNNQTPPPDFDRMTLVQKFSVVYNDGTVEMATPVGNVYTVLIANPGEELWIDTSNLVKV